MTAGVPRIAIELARLAVEADELVQQLAALPLTDTDAILLAAPARHLAIASDGLDELLHLVECLDQSHRGQPGYPPRPGELREAA